MGQFQPVEGIVELGMGVMGCLDTKGVWRQYLDGIGISNGLAWTRDAKTMFYIDSIPRKLYAFDFDNEKGTICKSHALRYYFDDHHHLDFHYNQPLEGRSHVHSQPELVDDLSFYSH